MDLGATTVGQLEATTRHIQDLLAPAGVRVSGTTVAAGSGGPVDGVRVVLMAVDSRRPGSTHAVGGVAQRENGRQLTVWIFPPVVAGGLGLELARQPLWSAVQKLQFSRALAVVVLHELAHALVGAGHRPAGLMSPSLRRTRLLDPRLVVDADLHPAFRAAVARLEAEAADAAREEALTRVAASSR